MIPTSLALLVVSGHPDFGGILSATFRTKAPLMGIWAKTFWEPLQPNTDASPFPSRGVGLSYPGIPTLQTWGLCLSLTSFSPWPESISPRSSAPSCAQFPADFLGVLLVWALSPTRLPYGIIQQLWSSSRPPDRSILHCKADQVPSQFKFLCGLLCEGPLQPDPNRLLQLQPQTLTSNKPMLVPHGFFHSQMCRALLQL